MNVLIEFEVMCKTKFGEVAVICGNLPDLGEWQPHNGLRLKTDELSYPYWITQSPIQVAQGTTIEFKLCLLNDKRNVVRWEEIQPNRVLSPKSSLMIQFDDSEEPMMIQVVKRKQFSECELEVSNIRKGTADVIDITEDLASDSSSNRDMWKEHKFPEDEQGSWLLNQFVYSLDKAVSTQREQAVLYLQQPQMQQQKQITIPRQSHRPKRIHYFIADSNARASVVPSSMDEVVFVPPQNLSSIHLQDQKNISIFHVFASESNWKSTLEELIRLRQAAEMALGRNTGSLVVLYLKQLLEGVCLKQVDMVVCSSASTASDVGQSFGDQGYRIMSTGKNEFVIMEREGIFKLKVMLEEMEGEDLFNDLESYLGRFLPSIADFHFCLHGYEMRRQLTSVLENIRLPNYRCLVVLHLHKLEELSLKVTGDLVQLSSLKHDVVVVILIHESLPKNIRDRVPAFNNNLLVLSTQGQVFFNSNDPIDLFKFIEISKAKFEQNLHLIINETESPLIRVNDLTLNRATLAIKSKILEAVLRQWIVKSVRNVNKRSIAKISINMNGNFVDLVPFVLHPNFLLKTALMAFAGSIRGNEKGLVLSIETEGINNLKWLEPPEGREVNLDFCRFRLRRKQKRYSFGSIPIGEEEMKELLDVIAQLSQETSKLEDDDG